MDRESFLLKRDLIVRRMDDDRLLLSQHQFGLLRALKPLAVPYLLKSVATVAGIPLVQYLLRKKGFFNHRNN